MRSAHLALHFLYNATAAEPLTIVLICREVLPPKPERCCIRRAELSDAAALYSLQAHTLPAMQHSILSINEIGRLISTCSTIQYVVDVGGEIVAAVLLRLQTNLDERCGEVGLGNGQHRVELALAAVHHALTQSGDIAGSLG
jgi:hypothetical protein